MQLVLFLGKVKIHATPDALHTPGAPLVKDFPHAHDLRVACDKDVEVAGKRILQRCHLKELRHQLVRIHAALEIDGELQSAQVGLIAHIVDLSDLPALDELGDLVDHGLGSRGIRDLVDLNDVFLRNIPPLGTHAEAAAAGVVDALHLRAVKDDLTARGKVRRGERQEKIMPRIAQIVDCRLADLIEIKAADHARHTDGNAVVGRDEHVWERCRQQSRFLHAAVIVIDKIDRVLVDVAEHLGADRRKLSLGITGGGIGHIARKDLAEVAL